MVRREVVLDGTWQFLLDPADRYADALPDAGAFESPIRVPGSWEEQGYGDESPFAQIDTWTKTRQYVGAAWYRTTFDWHEADQAIATGRGAADDRETDQAIAADQGAACWQLTLKGVRWTSEAWVNGSYAGLQDSLSAPHVHSLNREALRPGTNDLLIRVDNRMRLPLADSHIHTRHTATEWGGIAGGATLSALPRLRIAQLAVTPDVEAGAFHCRVKLNGDAGLAPLADAKYALLARFRAPDGRVSEAEASCDGETVSWTCSLGSEPVLWSDANPQLYEAEFLLQHEGDIVDRQTRRVGLRQLRAAGKQLLLNGQPVFLRGYVDCCIFPLTGYPVWDKAHYERQFRIAKSYGFNHVRLHGWNAPEPFWEAADEAGMLVQTELPHWSAHYQPRGAKPPEAVDAFLEAELVRIYETLNAHPSFVLFSLGNELIEDNGHERLNELVRLARTLDPSRLVTDNTGFGQLPEQDREGDFFIQSFNWHKPLKTEEIALPETNRDFSALTRLTDKPVIGHEHAQFAMYVRPQEKTKYTGVLRPTWLDAIEETLQRQGLTDRIDELIEASGRHLARSLKEAMERIRRTPDAAGVQLLDIRDFPGQGHATTGLLDVFWDCKGVLDAGQALAFNGPTVVLMACERRTWYAGERLQARLSISHYGEAESLQGRLAWRLRRGEDVLAEGELPASGIRRGEVAEVGVAGWRVPASDTDASAVVLEAWWRDDGVAQGSENRAIRNEWTFWTFPQVRRFAQASSVWSSASVLKTALYGATVEPNSRFDARTYPAERGVRLAIVERLTTNVLQYLTGGGSVWMLAGASELYDAVMTKYLPVFWNYLMFSEQAGGTMGAVVREHPALGGFPRDGYSDWQWYHLFNGSPAICLDAVPEILPLIEPIDNFNRAKRLAYMFEARVGSGRLFVTSLNFRDPDDWKRPESAYLFREILHYLLGEAFRPDRSITVGQLLSLFRLRGIHTFM